MRIRRATAADCAPMWAVHTRAIRHGCASHYAPGDIAAWSGRKTPESYAEPLFTRTLLVAEVDDGRVAGFAQFEPGEGVIEGVYVDPDFSRQGIYAKNPHVPRIMERGQSFFWNCRNGIIYSTRPQI